MTRSADNKTGIADQTGLDDLLATVVNNSLVQELQAQRSQDSTGTKASRAQAINRLLAIWNPLGRKACQVTVIRRDGSLAGSLAESYDLLAAS